MPEALRVGGVQTFTSLDFPGRHAAVVFCQGCPLRCVYCHNPDLIPASGTSPLSWTDIRNLLEEREGLLDGVVFSGGEPLAQKALPAAIREVRSMGYSAALHTSGALPERFSAVLPELDWVGFDLKAPFGDYEALTGVPGAGERVRRAYASLLRSGVEHEIRTTVWPGQLGSRRASIRVLPNTLYCRRPAIRAMAGRWAERLCSMRVCSPVWSSALRMSPSDARQADAGQ